MNTPRPITALVPWYGSNRSLAGNVGAVLAGCSWVGVPFAGGMTELRHVAARTVVVGDLHRHVLALAGVVAHPEMGPRLIRRLRRWVFHPEALSAAQERCRRRERDGSPGADLVQWAEDYFVCSWMARNGTAGTAGEFTAKLSVRWDAGGGDSPLRFRNAVEGLREWRRVLARCTFVVAGVFDFLAKVKDEPGHGVYADPPFPGPGDRYKHTFGEDTHRRLAERLAAFRRCKVVCRFYRHPLVEELYPAAAGWEWRELEGGRTQANEAAPEVLIVRNGGAA